MIGFNMIICRYAPATQLWRGRLHVMGGSKENRHTPSVDHWSIAVKDGKALEKEWRKEAPIPRGGPHRACVVMSDRLFLIGGQEGDFMPKPGSPIFKCSRRHEVVYGDAYMLDSEMKWKVLPPMPKPNSHIESSLAAIMETYHTKEDVSSTLNRNYNRTAARLYIQITFEYFKGRAARLYSLNIFERPRSLNSQRTELSLAVTASSSEFGTEKRPNPPSYYLAS
ncbi:unnamed protein product [Prunus armeniaca]